MAGLHDLWFKTRILHRNINIDSIMYEIRNGRYYFVQTDFDIGEMLQSVGDALSGITAQTGVDLVLFHGDAGIKHVSVRGDENGLSYTLSHVRSIKLYSEVRF